MAEFDPGEGFGSCSSSVAPVYNHSVPNSASFFGDMMLVPPGVVDARQWHPGREETANRRQRDGHVIVGVARVH